MAVHDGRIVFVKFILQGVITFQDKNTGRFDDPFKLLARIAFQHQDGTWFHTFQIAVNLFGESPEPLAAVPERGKLGHAV